MYVSDDLDVMFERKKEMLIFKGEWIWKWWVHTGKKNEVQWTRLKECESLTWDYQAHGWPDNVKGPSPIAYKDKNIIPHEMTLDDIKSLVQAFGDATRRAIEAGFDVSSPLPCP